MALLGRIADLRYLGWDVGVRAMARVSGHTRGDRLDFRLATSARDLLTDKRQALRDEIEALLSEAQELRGDLEAVAGSLVRTGSSVNTDAALRAVRDLRRAVGQQIPPELLQRVADALPEPDAERLRDCLRVGPRDEELPAR